MPESLSKNGEKDGLLNIKWKKIKMKEAWFSKGERNMI